LGPAVVNELRQTQTIRATGHVDVSEENHHLAAALEAGERIDGAGGFQNSISTILKNFSADHANKIFVIDNQNSLSLLGFHQGRTRREASSSDGKAYSRAPAAHLSCQATAQRASSDQGIGRPGLLSGRREVKSAVVEDL